MSKIKKRHIEIIKREIDHWEGKLSMDDFAEHLAKILNVGSLSRGTLYNLMKDYPELKSRFEAARERYRDQKLQGKLVSEEAADQLLAEANVKIEKLKSENASLKKDVHRLNQVIVQMLYNAYYEKLDVDNLRSPVDSPDAEEALKTSDAREKLSFLNKGLPPAKPK